MEESSKEQVKAIYEQIGQGFVEKYRTGEIRSDDILAFPPHVEYWMRHKLATAFSLGRFTKEDRLLDVGCTAGDYALWLGRRGFTVDGLDISEESIQAATLAASALGLDQARFITSDVDRMVEVEDGTYDGVYSFSALRYVPDPLVSLRELHRVVKRGGRVVVDFPNRLSPWFGSLKFLVGGERHIHDHTYFTNEILLLMQRAGFVNVEARRILFWSKLFPARFTPVYKVVDSVAEDLPGINHLAGIVVCKGEKPAE